jgi:hypothetical protein
MPIRGPFEYTYDRILAVLSADAQLLALVPKTNMTPTYDKAEKKGHNAITYGWPSRSYNPKTRKGTGTLIFYIGAVDSKTVANTIYGHLIRLLTAKNLSDTNLKVARITETSDSSDENVDREDRNVVQLKYDVRLVYLE